MISKVLVANRGEIAIRIMRACREIGIKSVAVYSEADRNALFAKYADEAYFIGPAKATESYLNIDKIIETCKMCGADAVHPGYGFLSENAAFAKACEDNGIKFIGPNHKLISLMGSKVAARTALRNVDVPLVPGCEDLITDIEQAKVIAKMIGYPVIVKPSGGGGGIGMKVAESEEELADAIRQAQEMAGKAFGDSGVYLEHFITNPRHIEVQVVGDSFGNVIHLGERECSIQRRYQKVIEESPCCALSEATRQLMGEVAVRVAKAVHYESVGTVEFIYSKGKFYFMEMNTRVQVEHPVTEMVTGVDIVKEQISIANGNPLSFKQEDIRLNGCAIECRINAEDPLNDFAPQFGKLRGYRSPGGVGVRVDSGIHTKYTIPYMYDSMISKLIVWGRTRDEAIRRMRRALYEYIIVGVKTNIPFHKAVMDNERFIKGDLSTHFIEDEYENWNKEMKRIIEEETPLADKLGEIFRDNQNVAAIAGVMAYMQQNNKENTK